MSIEKLSDLSKSELEKNPFAQIANEVILHVKDNDSFRLYCYLAAKSREWKVIKCYASKICNISESKSKKCWSYLARCGLIEYKVIKDDNNIIIKHDLFVLNGTKFNKDEPFLKNEKLSTVHRVKNPPSGKSTRVENDPLLNKDNNQKNKELLNRKICDKKIYNPIGKSPTTYIERNTVTNEFKEAKRGSTKNEEIFMENLPDSLKPNRYKKKESIVNSIHHKRE